MVKNSTEKLFPNVKLNNAVDRVKSVFTNLLYEINQREKNGLG